MFKKIKYSFTIYGESMSKGRHRTTKEGIAYTPSKIVNYENLVKYSFIESIKTNNALLEEPLHMEIKEYFKIPKSATRNKKQQMIEGLIRLTKKPDVDNIQKIIADSLNSLAYYDDRQIVSCNVETWYGEVPRVQVVILER